MTHTADLSDGSDSTVAESVLCTLRDNGVDYIFANFGTDHTPLIEAAARLRDDREEDSFPEFIPCPHEYVALSAAHGYAAVTGDPQAVLVHVDVGTQNLGAAMHNAHRANVPIFVMAGLSPVSDAAGLGGRDHPIHYFQDVFDQTSIVSEYCRWTNEYQPPADPREVVRRGLERAASTPPGPTYLSFGREAFESPVPKPTQEIGTVRQTRPTGADRETVADLTDQIEEADRPLVITSNSLGTDSVDTLVSFAETAGAGVVEHIPSALCFPRDHDLHVGFDATEALAHADLLLLLETDVPWVPSETDVPSDLNVVQIDTDPTKAAYPHWPFTVDHTVMADPSETIQAVTGQIDEGADNTVWREMHRERIETASDRVNSDRADDRLTPTVLSNEISKYVDEDTIVMEGVVTNRQATLHQIPLSEPGSYFWRGGAGLGWAVPAGIGAKLASPESRVISLIGDGGYLFSNPASSIITAENAIAPTLTVIYNNESWEAVREATRSQHGNGASAMDGVPEGSYGRSVDFSRIATMSDGYTRAIDDIGVVSEALNEAVDAVDNGTNAVLDVRLDE
ncbi:thiamine pyrophosphate-requiring protein [Natronococcus jeotgali]|uniref:Acetolactate synthase catalytic subunit n=1 Tax=Natronococcus jeotgali DSM 18795 TaxID=1227498 RepID=L9XH89_9EURY|nr:thiamine pyrophosphate-requiring protein [Natronococcus jeotgali]ELY60023.1 acetolactate synthase catalytic subunit [Natronococcus jeotgali DSM 18795]